MAKLIVDLIKTKFMSKTIEIGKNGEEQAAEFLKEAGYQILALNWRFRHLEIDIIAQKGKELIIVEVKTRETDIFGTPESFVTKDKQRKLIKAANEYVIQNNLDLEVRFDIISVITSTNKVYHIKDSFYTGLH
ncbi:MAG TPA: YraN family protein [Bacteroidia bacterium]